MSDHDIEVTMTLNLAGPGEPEGKLGREIIAAVQALAGDTFRARTRVVDDVTTSVLVLGRYSAFPYEDLIIEVDESMEVDPDTMYRKLAVKYHPWPGSKYAIGYTSDSIVHAMRDFRDKLREELRILTD